MIVVVVVVGLFVFFWLQKFGMVLLYIGLDQKVIVEVIDLLCVVQILFVFDLVIGGIIVLEKNLYDVCLKLVGFGLIDSGKFGFELMECDLGFGVSQFVESVCYQYVLEIELLCIINMLCLVCDLCVYLVIFKFSVFICQCDVVSVLVILELWGGQQLECSQVDVIVYMVVVSILDFVLEWVIVVDQSGCMFSIIDLNSEVVVNVVQFEQVCCQEILFNQCICELLELMIGFGCVNLEVSVDMDFLVIEEVCEFYNGELQKLCSEQMSENIISILGLQGVLGVISNSLLGQQVVLVIVQILIESSKNVICNYELDCILQYICQLVGCIKCVLVVVLVDNVLCVGVNGKMSLQLLLVVELICVEVLVKQVVGFNVECGDIVLVMNVLFV